MENKIKDFDLIKATYNVDDETFTGYVYQKNAYLMLQSLHFIVTMIEQEYGRDFDSILNDLKKLNSGIKKYNREKKENK